MTAAIWKTEEEQLCVWKLDMTAEHIEAGRIIVGDDYFFSGEDGELITEDNNS